jgi:hypothetical protein
MRRYERLSRVPVVVLSGTDWPVGGLPVVKVLAKKDSTEALLTVARAYGGVPAPASQ